MAHIRAKIVCTLGPSSASPDMIRRLIRAGMNVARLNFSHGTREDHREVIGRIRSAAAESGRLVAIMLDLQGPKLRVGRFRHGPVTLASGGTFTITTREVEGDETIVSTSYPGLADDLQVDDTVLLDDGMISLRVERKTDTDILCRVVEGGELRDNKGINVPGVPLSVSTLTRKDLDDIDFGVEQDVDFVAMSFVRQPSDMLLLREYLRAKGANIPVVAKIEKPEAIAHIDEIIAVSDSVMVARGDLGVEMPPQDVPAIQKMIIAKCNRAGVPVITATQMLDSMINHPRPTRAEASDVANAILDGTDAVMLSGETASGRYPEESVQTMHRIIAATEESRPEPTGRRRWQGEVLPINEGIAANACSLSDYVGAKAIVSITLSGSMARAIAKHRPTKPIFAISQRAHELRRLCLVWGIEGVWMGDLNASIDEAVLEIENLLENQNHLRKGDRLVLTAGMPFAERKATNMVRVDVMR